MFVLASRLQIKQVVSRINMEISINPHSSDSATCILHVGADHHH